MRHIKENVIEKEQNSISLRALIKLKQNMDLSLGITKMVFKKKEISAATPDSSHSAVCSST